MRCATHVINLIVKDGLQEIDGVIENIRESVKYIRGSPNEKFEEIIGELGINCGGALHLMLPHVGTRLVTC